MKRNKLYEKIIEKLLFICAIISVAGVVFIILFVMLEGMPLFRHVNAASFLFSTDWAPTREGNPGYGILSFIVGSFMVTGGALLISVPIGVSTAIFMAESAKGLVARILREVVNLLAGIPSVIYGFFGVVVLSGYLRELFGGTGFNVLSGSIILAIMILPTIINVAEVSIRSISQENKAGSLALGATKSQTLFNVVLPEAKSGIIAGIVLGVGRAIGETMAILMVAGNAPIMPTGPLSKVRTLTMNIVTDMGYAAGNHRTALFTTSIVLMFFILLVNLSVRRITSKQKEAK